MNYINSCVLNLLPFFKARIWDNSHERAGARVTPEGGCRVVFGSDIRTITKPHLLLLVEISPTYVVPP